MLGKIEAEEFYAEHYLKILEIHEAIEEDLEILSKGQVKTYITKELSNLEIEDINNNIKRLKFGLVSEFDDLQEKCADLKRHSVFSRFINFENNYDQQMNKFLNRFYDSRESDYIESQIEIYEELPQKFHLLEEYLIFSCKRKIEFLTKRLEEETTANEDDSRKPYSSFQTVFLLKELGVIDFLLKRPLTQEKIAKLIGLIHGRHFKNINDFMSTVPNRDQTKNLGSKHKFETKQIIDIVDTL